MKFKLNKKGDVTDPMIILIILAFLSVSFIIAIFVNTKLSTIISTTELSNSAAAPSILAAFSNLNATAVQNGFILMFGIMVLFLLVSSFLIRVHPAFFFLYVFILMATIFCAVFIGNFYDKLSENATLGPIINAQPKISFIMDNIVIIIMGLGGLSMIIVFSKIFSNPSGGASF